MRKSTRHVRRALVCAVTAAIATALIVPIVARVIEWRERSQAILELTESEAHALGNGRPASPETFFPIDVVPRPPIVSGFEVLTTESAVDQIGDQELVLGAVINGQARAWPLNIMTGPEREVFNDTLGGRSIAATW